MFGIPGIDNLEIFRHLGESGIRHITPRHEQGAGYAAYGYARVTGRPGVVLTTAGPGLLNAAAAAGQAYSDSVPVLFLSAGPPRGQEPGDGLLHEVKDQTGAMNAICAWSERADGPGMLKELLGKAFREFRTCRPRPAHVEIPADVLADVVADVLATEAAWAGPGENPPAGGGERAPAEELSGPGGIEHAARLLAGARRPVVIAGGGARAASAAVTCLAEETGAPVITTANGKGVIDEDHRNALGAALHLESARDFLRRADVVIAVGTELSDTDTWSGPLALTGDVIRVDIDPGQSHRNAVAACALTGDADAVLRRVLAALGSVPDRAGASGAYLREIAGVRARIEAEHAGLGAPWAGLIDAMRAAMPPEAVLTSDSSMVCHYGAIKGFRVPAPDSFLHPTGFGTLGFALPAAIGALAGRPERPVVALTGDGGLQFTVNELATAVMLGKPLPVVIVDNGGYGSVRREQARLGVAPLGTDLPSPDFAALAAAYGAHGVAAGSPGSVAAEISAALERPGPTLITIPEHSLTTPEGCDE
ncbi:putative 2-ketoarginine decarboxylase AruI [Streptomyces hiroshimensis]|uniref:2-ketoarginine decarboxylase AruI n=1 Tax=Streptomyces hiroshimensis TaxID=66424 RepID=A0ABQ2Y693_9ACTN|nr:putative 2-ketoarginine decarboxylase AruI [Streptomyces hiroshimensis]